MRFGPVAPAEAEGAVLAHSLNVGGQRLRKGRVLSAADVAALADAGVAEVTVARLGPGRRARGCGRRGGGRGAGAGAGGARARARSAPFTGRVNLFAEAAGVLRVDAAAVAALNAVDPGVTLATLPDWARVAPRQMVATVKVIPYGIEAEQVSPRRPPPAQARSGCTASAPARASLILTRTPGFKESLLAKGAGAVRGSGSRRSAGRWRRR